MYAGGKNLLTFARSAWHVTEIFSLSLIFLLFFLTYR